MTVSSWAWLLGLFLVDTAFAAWVVRKYRNSYGWGVLTALMAIYITSANILVPRLVDVGAIGDFGLVIVTGSVIFPFVSNIVDMINEIYGKTRAYVSVALAYGANLMFVGFVYMSFTITEVWESSQEAFYVEYFSLSWRVLLASLASYIVSQTWNVYVFDWIKRRFAPREWSLWGVTKFSFARSWTSDLGVTLLENPVFYFGAFWFILPTDLIVDIMIAALLFKLLLAQVQQPFFLMFRYITRHVEREGLNAFTTVRSR